MTTIQGVWKLDGCDNVDAVCYAYNLQGEKRKKFKALLQSDVKEDIDMDAHGFVRTTFSNGQKIWSYFIKWDEYTNCMRLMDPTAMGPTVFTRDTENKMSGIERGSLDVEILVETSGPKHDHLTLQFNVLDTSGTMRFVKSKLTAEERKQKL